MSNNFDVNISEDTVKEYLINEEKKKEKKTFFTFDPKNYLNTKLENGEDSKTLTIRILPPNKDGGFPFQKVYVHQVKVNKEVSPTGWKTLPCPKQNGFDDHCPFCEVSHQAYASKSKDGITLSEKEKYDDIAKSNKAKLMYIVRCIERGHENDGVKFWMMSAAKEGPYEKIMKLWTSRYNNGIKKGENINIFDLNKGKDLEITITKSDNDKSVYSVVDDPDYSPLTTDFELGNKWINDDKKWFDVYRVKPYDYMSIILEGDVPYFNKDKNCYVGKYAEEEEKKKKAAEAEAEAEAEVEETPIMGYNFTNKKGYDSLPY